MSLTPQKLQPYSLPSSQSSRSLSNQTIAILSIGSIVFINVTLAAYRDYKIYLSYGPGGLPYNIRGWFISSCILRPCGTEVFSTDLYDQNPDKRKWLSSEWPPYEREQRPRLGPHPLPQRQLDQLPEEECKEVCLYICFQTIPYYTIHFCLLLLLLWFHSCIDYLTVYTAPQIRIQPSRHLQPIHNPIPPLSP